MFPKINFPRFIGPLISQLLDTVKIFPSLTGTDVLVAFVEPLEAFSADALR